MLLSNLVWTNRGQTSGPTADNFGTVFGANAEGARRVVDAVLKTWSTVLVNLNQPTANGTPDRNTINFTISMNLAETGFGGSANATDFAYPSFDDVGLRRNGFPIAGTITLDRGNANEPNSGFWIDPTPEEHSEFTDILSPFAANPGPAVTGSDIYSTINAEIVHVLGLWDAPAQIQNPLNNSSITRLNLPDLAHGNGKGFYYVFDGPSGTHLMTSYDSGGGGRDVGALTHTAGPTATNYPVSFTSRFRGAVQLRGSIDPGNAAGGNARFLASDNVAQFLHDAYNYTVKMPSSLGYIFNVSLQDRQLVVRGGPDGGQTAAPTTAGAHSASDAGEGAHHGVGPNFDDAGADSSDRFTFTREGDELVITTDLGRDGPVGGLDEDGDGNAPAFTTRIALSDFDSLVIDTGHGDDTVVFDLSGGDFLPDDTIFYDGEEGSDELIIKIGNNANFHDDLVFQSMADGSANVKVISTRNDGTGSSTAHMSLSSMTHVILDGGDPVDTTSTLLIDELVATDALTPPPEIPTHVPVTQTNFKAVTVLNANPVTFYRAYNPGVDEHFFTTSFPEFANAVAHGFRDESSGTQDGFSILPTRSPGSVPVYRLYNFHSGTHYLTTHAAESDFLVGLIPTTSPSYGEIGWRLESSGGFIFPEQVPGSVEIFRLYNRHSGTHLLTANPAERDSILARFPHVWELHDHFGYAFPVGFLVGQQSAAAQVQPAVSQSETIAPVMSMLEGDATDSSQSTAWLASLVADLDDVAATIAADATEVSVVAPVDPGRSPVLSVPAEDATPDGDLLTEQLSAFDLASVWQDIESWDW